MLLFVIFLTAIFFLVSMFFPKRQASQAAAPPVAARAWSPRQVAFDEDVAVFREAYRQHKIDQHKAEVMASVASMAGSGGAVAKK